MRQPYDSNEKPGQEQDSGFMLLAVIVMIFMLLLLLSVAAPRVARSMQREREVESTRRARQYVRAIQVYYQKLGHYPASMEQLEKTNNIRFIRQRYVDPLTGKADWRLIHVGENKTKVKGFFGEDLPGLQVGLGAAAGMQSSLGSSGVGATAGGVGTLGSGSTFNNNAGVGAASGAAGGSGSGFNNNMAGGSGSGSGSGSSSGPGGSGTGGFGSQGLGGSTGVGSQSATSFTGGGGPIIGVGSSKSGDAMVVVNEMATYQEWEFLYDPRVEQMKAKATLLGGLSSGGGAGGFPGAGGSPGTGGFPGAGGFPGLNNGTPGGLNSPGTATPRGPTRP